MCHFAPTKWLSSRFQIFSFDIPTAQTPPLPAGSTTLDGVGFVTLSELLITGFVLAPAFAEAIGGVYSRPRGAEAV